MSGHWQEEEFIPYLDGRMSAAERKRLDDHLATCDACRAQLHELRLVMGVLGEWKAAEPTPGFDAALRARLVQEPAGRREWFTLRPAYAVALAVVILVAVGVALWQLAPAPVPPPPPQVVQAPAQKPVPPAPTVTTPPTPAAATDELAVLDNPVLLENYELLDQFDVLFEPAPKKGKKL